jgi:hypothetical protein
VFFTSKRLKLYLGALLVLQLCTCLAFISPVRGRYIDFRTFYASGYMLRTGHAAQLYNYAAEQAFQSALVSPDPRALPMMSPPFAALPFAPLSHLGFWAAYFVFAALNILLLLASLVLLKPFLTALSSRWSAAPLLLFASFLPAAVALLMGQISLALLLILCACFVVLRRGHNLLAGLILSLALIKFQIALPIALLFLLWRQWRFIAGFLAGSALLARLSISILGLGNFTEYLRSLYSMTHNVTADRASQFHFGIIPSLMPNLYGLIFFITRGASWSHILILALSLALFIWAAVQRPSLSLALLTAMLVSYHLYFYDLTLLLLPLSLLADHLLRAPSSTPAKSHPRNTRLLITQISLGALLLLPLIRFFISVNQSCLLAIPILTLVLCSPWWPTLHSTSPACGQTSTLS